MITQGKIGKYLEGGDLRSKGKVESLIPLIKDQKDFDILFGQLYSIKRIVVMRAADAMEKLTIGNPGYLGSHKNELLTFLGSAKNKELKWHLASLVSRLSLTRDELEIVFAKLRKWARDPLESKIVRVNSLQAIFELIHQDQGLEKEFNSLVKELEKEGVPSINSRIRKIKNKA